MNEMLKTMILVVLALVCSFSSVDGHGYMYSPRSLNWRAHVDGLDWGTEAGKPIKEYCHHCLNVKGETEMCGSSDSRSYDDFRDSLGNPMPWLSEETYNEGQLITVKSDLPVHHWGHIEMRVCPNGENPTLECFNNNPLEFHDDPKYGAPKDPNYPYRGHYADKQKTDYEMRFKLPDGIFGEKVLLQYKYITANSCNPPGYENYPWPDSSWWFGPQLPACILPYPEDGSRRPGAPEQFWNCAQVTILPSNPTISPRPTPIAPPPTTATNPPPPSPSPPPPPPPIRPRGGTNNNCCSWDFKNCGSYAWCDVSDQNCASCGGLAMIEMGSCSSGLGLYEECTANVNGCCAPTTCQGSNWYKQCLLSDSNPVPSYPSPTPPSPTPPSPTPPSPTPPTTPTPPSPTLPTPPSPTPPSPPTPPTPPTPQNPPTPPSPTPAALQEGCPEGWKPARWTWYVSYCACCPESPNYDPNAPTEECTQYSCCSYMGQFSYISPRTFDWVKTNNIVAFYSDNGDNDDYNAKMIRVMAQGKTVEARVADTCGNADCNNCCTNNAQARPEYGGYLVDMEYWTVINNFGSLEGADGLVCWQVFDAPNTGYCNWNNCDGVESELQTCEVDEGNCEDWCSGTWCDLETPGTTPAPQTPSPQTPSPQTPSPQTPSPQTSPPPPPVTPSPNTSPPTPSNPTESARFCCTDDYKTCSATEWCNESEANCNGCSGLAYIEENSCSNVELYGTCTGGLECCGPATCQGTEWYSQCKL